jgi:lia operon protein LiaG
MKTNTGAKPKTWVFLNPSSRVQQKGFPFFFGFLIIAMLSSCLDHGMDVVQDIQEEFEGITSISVDAAFLEAHYEGLPDKDVVSLDALLKSNRESSYIIRYKVQGETLKIEVVSRGGGRLGNLRTDGHIWLKGPSNMELDLNAGSGKVSAANTEGENHSLSVGSGKVVATGLKSKAIRLQASSGVIMATSLEGDILVDVSSGKIDVDKVKGKVSAEASSGKIQLTNIEGLVGAKVTSGNIQLSKIAEIGPLQISSGKITGSHCGLGPFSSLKATSGKIEIQSSTPLQHFNYALSATSGRVSVGNQQSRGNLNIQNGSPHTITGTVTSGQLAIW